MLHFVNMIDYRDRFVEIEESSSIWNMSVSELEAAIQQEWGYGWVLEA